MKRYFKTTWFSLLLAAAAVFLLPSCAWAQTTFDLTSVEPDQIPSGVTLEWHTALPVDASNIYATPATATPGLYYAVFNYGGGCYSTPSPYRIGKTACPTPNADLTQLADPATVPAGMQVTYHTASPATDANVFPGDPTAAAPGKYYLAYHDQTSLCYSRTTPVVILDYAADPAPVAVADSSGGNVLGQEAFAHVLPNDTLSDGEVASIEECDMTLTTTGLPAGSVLNGDGSVTVPGQGTWSYDYTTGQIKFQPLSGFRDNPKPLTYMLTDNSTCKSSTALVKILFEGAMPVTLISFEAKVVEKTADLTWVTEMEFNASHFEIQRSANAKDFTAIANVSAKNAKSSYQFTDLLPLAGTSYYRLKMIDLDSTYAFSRITNINLEGNGPLSIYPNPAGRLVQISIAGALSKPAKAMLYDQTGQLRASFALTADHKIDVSGLPEGLYLVRVLCQNGTAYSTRIVIQKQVGL